jgi:hypothetical protein
MHAVGMVSDNGARLPPQFEAMRECMKRNPAAFKNVLEDVEELARTNAPYPEEVAAGQPAASGPAQ